MASAASMTVRFRRSVGEERQQLKWFASAAALLAVSFPTVGIVSSGLLEDFVTLIFASLPIAVGIAVLRYRLYNIDRVINRTLVYVPLTIVLSGVYLGAIVVLQYLFRALTGYEEQPQLAVVASTLAIAALFNPLRRRIQGVVDRRFYRDKYDARKTLEAFSARLRDKTDLEDLGDELAEVVRGTVRPAHISVWIREPERDSGAE